MKTFYLLMLVLLSAQVVAQYSPEQSPDVSLEIAGTITGDDIASYLNVLASDEYEGRETGYPGNQKAAEFIAEQIEKMGIPPVESLEGYFQPLIFSRIKIKEADLVVNDQEYYHMKDFVAVPAYMPSDAEQVSSSEIVFMGYGVDSDAYSDYTYAPDLAGKSILIYSGEPTDADGVSLITGTTENSEWAFSLDKKLKAAKAHGVSDVFIVSRNFRALAGSQRRAILTGETLMGEYGERDDYCTNWVISSTLTEALMGKKIKKVIKRRDKIAKKGKLKPFSIPTTITGNQNRQVRATTGSNVLAYIEGTDSKLKDELVVVTAHYDHVGFRGKEVFNGADDNASGTSGVLEIAQAFQTAKEKGYGPRRSVLCMLVTGEEKGLLGSQYYSEFPVFPLENTVANINIDMIGRIDDKHDNDEYIYVIGADRLSSELHEINETANATYTKLELDYTYNAEDDPNQFYYRSDHYNFAKNGVPAIFYFSGTHEDYHRPSDTADKIMFDRAARVARLAFHTAWELANRDERIQVDRS